RKDNIKEALHKAMISVMKRNIAQREHGQAVHIFDASPMRYEVEEIGNDAAVDAFPVTEIDDGSQLFRGPFQSDDDGVDLLAFADGLQLFQIADAIRRHLLRHLRFRSERSANAIAIKRILFHTLDKAKC